MTISRCWVRCVNILQIQPGLAFKSRSKVGGESEWVASRRTQSPLLSLSAPSILKQAPRQRPGHVAFDGITVYYFPRCQGFTSVPSRGGCTLGMASRHSTCRLFSLAEFTQEQVRARREKLRRRLKEERLEMLRWKVRRPVAPVSTLQVQGYGPVLVSGEVQWLGL